MVTKAFLFLILFLGLLTGIRGQHLQDSLWFVHNYSKRETYIEMRDGVRLFTSVYAPKDTTEDHPILFLRGPYSCAPYGEKNYFAGFWSHYFKYYARENYIVVFQDVRGRYMSEGDFVNVRPYRQVKKSKEDIDESTDAFDSIDWLIKNVQHNNGNVGAMGISYPGFYSFMAARSGHPALKAVSPQAPVSDWFMGDDVHHNGALFLLNAFSFFVDSGFGYERKGLITERTAPKIDVNRQDNYHTYLNIGPLKNFRKLVGDSVPFWNEIYQHPNLDDWWEARNTRNYVNQLKPAILIVGGLFDSEDCFGAWNLYKAIEEKNPNIANKIVMGPWYHGQWSSSEGGRSLGPIDFGGYTGYWYQNNIELPFFNYYLKNKGAVSPAEEATIFFTGVNEWRQFDQWPPKGVKQRSLYLMSSKKLSWQKPKEEKGFSQYRSDPDKPVPYESDVHFYPTRDYLIGDQRFASRRPDVLTFESDVLREDVTVAGPITADLFTSISTTDADFIVKVIDSFPDTLHYPDSLRQLFRPEYADYPLGGYQMLVRGEVMRGKYRRSFREPQPFKPDNVEEVRFTLPDIAHTFKKGHKIVVQIQSTWFPLVDRNPQQFVNIYTCDADDFVESLIRIFHSRSMASHLVLPVLDQA